MQKYHNQYSIKWVTVLLGKDKVHFDYYSLKCKKTAKMTIQDKGA